MGRNSRRQDIADIFGRPRVVPYFGHNGLFDFAVRSWEPDLEAVSADTETVQSCDSDDHRTAHYFEILLEAARPLLTDKQYEAAVHTIVKGRSFRDVARELGGSSDKWRQRIEGTTKKGRTTGGIRKKAPELYAIWIFRNRSKRDIAEVINAIHRAIRHRHTQHSSQSSQTKP